MSQLCRQMCDSMTHLCPHLLILMSLSVLILLLSVGRTCDLLLTDRTWQRWWNVTSVTILHETVMSFLPTDFPSFQLQWCELPRAEAHMQGTEGSLKPIANQSQSPPSHLPQETEFCPQPHEFAGRCFYSQALRRDHSLCWYLKAEILKQKT